MEKGEKNYFSILMNKGGIRGGGWGYGITLLISSYGTYLSHKLLHGEPGVSGVNVDVVLHTPVLILNKEFIAGWRIKLIDNTKNELKTE